MPRKYLDSLIAASLAVEVGLRRVISTFVAARGAIDRSRTPRRGRLAILEDAQLGRLKSELTRMRAALLRKYTAGADAKRVVQLNLQMFPLSIDEA